MCIIDSLWSTTNSKFIHKIRAIGQIVHTLFNRLGRINQIHAFYIADDITILAFLIGHIRYQEFKYKLSTLTDCGWALLVASLHITCGNSHRSYETTAEKCSPTNHMHVHKPGTAESLFEVESPQKNLPHKLEWVKNYDLNNVQKHEELLNRSQFNYMILFFYMFTKRWILCYSYDSLWLIRKHFIMNDLLKTYFLSKQI